jgi:hypothetical protein
MRTHALLALALAACGTPSSTPRPAPRGLHAGGQLDVSREHDPAAHRWSLGWDTAENDARAAEEMCRTASLGDVSISPLLRHMIGGKNIEAGFAVYLDPNAVRPEELLPAIRCHRAWMLRADHGLADCPLALAGVRIAAHGDPSQITVELIVRDRDPALVSELQRRAAQDLAAVSSGHRRECDDY